MALCTYRSLLDDTGRNGSLMKNARSKLDVTWRKIRGRLSRVYLRIEFHLENCPKRDANRALLSLNFGNSLPKVQSVTSFFRLRRLFQALFGGSANLCNSKLVNKTENRAISLAPVKNRGFNASRFTRVRDSERCKRGTESSGSNLDSEMVVDQRSRPAFVTRSRATGSGVCRFSTRHQTPFLDATTIS